jgi:hypothetical protein
MRQRLGDGEHRHLDHRRNADGCPPLGTVTGVVIETLQPKGAGPSLDFINEFGFVLPKTTRGGNNQKPYNH